MNYGMTSGRDPDFRVKYTWVNQSQRLFQYMRSDFRYADDDNQIYAIYPEFEGSDFNILAKEAEIPEEGTATMWILFEEMKDKIHRDKIKVGTRAFMVSGAKVIGKIEVLEILKGLS